MRIYHQKNPSKFRNLKNLVKHRLETTKFVVSNMENSKYKMFKKNFFLLILNKTNVAKFKKIKLSFHALCIVKNGLAQSPNVRSNARSVNNVGNFLMT